MSIPSRLSQYLDQRGTRYEVCAHEASRTSVETARSARVPPRLLAKAVVLEDESGCVMAVVPANQTVVLGEVSRMLGRERLHLCDESRIAEIFTDCERGAVPSLGMPWGVETLVEEQLEDNDFVYLEAGDHQRLLRMSRDQFHQLMSGLPHGHFSKPLLH